MTTLKSIELTCPICWHRFDSKAVQSTNSFGGKRTDFHERAAGMQPLPYFIHLCLHCGYAGSEQDFGSDTDVSPVLREHVWEELAPRVQTVEHIGSEKYEFAAKVAAWQSAEPRRLADLLLRAAWCAFDESDYEAERYYRREAAWAFDEALQSYDGVEREERAVVTYLIGELWRRIGDLAQARTWFDRVEQELIDQATQQWVLDAARQQRDNPREWFG